MKPSASPSGSEAPTPFTVRPLAETFGVEVLDVELKEPFSPELLEAVTQLLGRRRVVLFRNQDISEALQDALTAALGEPRDQGEHAWAPVPDPEARVGRDGSLGPLPILNKGNLIYFVNGPELCEQDPTAVYTLDQENLRGGASCWHTGDSAKHRVESINILYPVIAPARKGDTLYCDTTAAYATLTEETKAEIEDLRVQHFTHFPPSTPELRLPDPTYPVDQPLVKQHPLSGEKYLYLNFNDMDRVLGFNRASSAALIERLFHHVTQPRFVYTHKWKSGDLVLWNCNGTLHKKGLMDPTVKRALRRTQCEIPALQSTRERDLTRVVETHDGESWHPYPFERAPKS